MSKHHSLVSKIFSQIKKNSPFSKSHDSSKFGSVHVECKIDSADFDQLWLIRVLALLKQKRPEDSNKDYTKCENNKTISPANSPIEANENIVISVGTRNVTGHTEKKNICMMCKLIWNSYIWNDLKITPIH